MARSVTVIPVGGKEGMPQLMTLPYNSGAHVFPFLFQEIVGAFMALPNKPIFVRLNESCHMLTTHQYCFSIFACCLKFGGEGDLENSVNNSDIMSHKSGADALMR